MQDTIKITTPDGEAERLMSWGLLDELNGIIGDIDQLAELVGSREMRNEVLTAVYSERDAKGERVGEVSLFPLAPDEVTRVIDWVGEHVADFFLKNATNANQLGTKLAERVKALQPTTPGGEG